MSKSKDAWEAAVIADRLTPALVQGLVDALRSDCGDAEVAHGEEDAIHQHVLECLSGGNIDEPAECARVALTTRGLNFVRWYA